MSQRSSAPVFYDIEASGLGGFPIEIGWARADLAFDTILSEGHLIRPPPIGTCSAPGIRWTLLATELWRTGKPAFEIAAA